MPIVVDGKTYPRIGEVAARYGVTGNTIRTWINDKVVPKPKYTKHGRRYIPYFPDDLLQEWDRALGRERK